MKRIFNFLSNPERIAYTLAPFLIGGLGLDITMFWYVFNLNVKNMPGWLLPVLIGCTIWSFFIATLITIDRGIKARYGN